MNDDLLISLRNYSPRREKDPIENYVTEAFSWILRNNELLFKEFIRKHFDEDIEKHKFINCETQINLNGLFPDMMITLDERKIIFEHKIWSELHSNQITNYRKHAQELFGDFKLAIITATPSQHLSDINDAVQLCWNQVFETINDWLIQNKDTENETIIKSFLRLLKSEGLGPTTPLSHASIKYYNITKNLPNAVENFFIELENKHKFRLLELFGQELSKENRWGRHGFRIFHHWNPGLFIGFLLQEKDHRVPPLDGDRSPDFSLIVSFHSEFHNKYEKSEKYKSFKKEVENIIKKSKFDWDIYDVSLKGKGQNMWHPLHIRIPMLELFKGTETLEEQIHKFFIYAEDIVPKIMQIDFLQEMKKNGLDS